MIFFQSFSFSFQEVYLTFYCFYILHKKTKHTTMGNNSFISNASLCLEKLMKQTYVSKSDKTISSN